MTTEPKQATYLLAHSDDELRRLEQQGAFLAPSTRDFLGRVGLERGMRVLDLGCGAGDVSLLAAELVGPSGEVVGVDRSEAALSSATARARARGAAHVRFLQRDLNELDELVAGQKFDALVCRLVMIHQREPAKVLGSVLRLVRPGGAVGFQEIDVDARYWSTRPLEGLEALWRAVGQVVERRFFSGNLAVEFAQAFDAAGLVDRRIIRSGAVESARSVGVYPWLGGFVRSLKAVVEPMGLSLEDLDVAGFEAKLKAEVEAKQAVFVPVHFLGAAGRLPPAPLR